MNPVIEADELLWYVCEFTDDIKAVEELIHKGATYVQRGLTLACLNERWPIIKYLANKLNNISYQLMTCALHNKVKVFKFLLTFGLANDKIHNGFDVKFWPYSMAIRNAIQANNIEIIKAIFAIPNPVFNDGWYITFACQHETSDILEFFIQDFINKTPDNHARYLTLLYQLRDCTNQACINVIKKYMHNYEPTTIEEARIMLNAGLCPKNQFALDLTATRDERIQHMNEAITNVHADHNMFDVNTLTLFNGYVEY